MRFSHKWANQVLLQRGLKSPGAQQISDFISLASEDDAGAMYSRLQRLERGTEGPSDASAVLQWLSSDTIMARPPATARKLVASPSSPPRGTELKAQASATPGEGATTGFPLQKIQRAKHHIYAQSAALTIEIDDLRLENEHGQFLQTVILEAAKSHGDRRYDWTNKISFQFMQRELPLLACSLLGKLRSPLALENHGTGANKSVVITDQQDKVYIQVKQRARVISVPVGPSDVHAWLALVFKALRANSPELGETLQLAALDRVAAMHNQI